MKLKHLLLSALMLSTGMAWADVMINVKNFPDANFRSYLTSQSYGSDGLLSDAEIAGIRSLMLSSKSIQNLSGIKFFTALQYLSCDGNQLTSLDVSGCETLIELDCSSNQLTSLDISGCSALTSIMCSQNQLKGDAIYNLIECLPKTQSGELYVIDIKSDGNAMTRDQVNGADAKGWTAYALDGSWYKYAGVNLNIHEIVFPDENFRKWLLGANYGKDGVLTDAEIAGVYTMDVSSQGIKSLQGIEYFTELVSLQCSVNQLTSLDVSKNTKLIKLYCGSNQLTSLNVSGCVMLEDLRCGNNQLTSLNVSGFTSLIGVFCYSNQLTSLKVSGCTELDGLWCYDNQLTSLDVSGCSALTTLYCYQNRIKGNAMDALISGLSRPLYYNDMRVIYNQNEENAMTPSQVAAAKAKNWTPKIWTGASWREYEGDDYIVVAAVDEKNFPDDNFRNWLLTQSYGRDTVLTNVEIARVSEIDVSSKNIQSLQGIEFFTSLNYLSCNSNQLTSLDVSKNTALVSLSCGSNQLTSLNVSKNTWLIWLHCGSNQLTSLNVSGCTALTELSCNDNQLTSLDVSKNTALTHLDCNNNKLTSLNVSGCTALTGLFCYSNQLTSLDVSNNTALTGLRCYSNRLASLNVSGCTALTGLFCYSNQLTSLDVSKNTKLTELVCYSNQLASLDVSKNTALTTLFCSDNQLTSLDVLGCTALKNLNCYQNKIYEADMDAFVESLPKVSSGEMRVIYNENEQNVMNITQVAAAKAKGWKSLYTEDGNIWKEYAGSELYINATIFPDDYFRNWLLIQSYGSDGVLTNTEVARVSEIDVSSMNIQSLQGIGCFTALTILKCAENQLTSLDVSKNTKLKELYCYDNQLISLNVSKNTNLKKLSCGNNQLASLDVSVCTALEWLSCYNNQLTSLDVSKNTALSELHCDKNQLTSLDVSKNSKLTYLFCYSNKLTSLKVKSSNSALLQMDIYQNRIRGDAMDALVNALPSKYGGTIHAIHYENEQNAMTYAQVKKLKNMLWTPYYADGTLNNYGFLVWYNYAGVDPATSVNTIDTSETDDSTPWYTISGVQLTEKPTQPGIYIHGGKKVLVK